MLKNALKVYNCVKWDPLILKRHAGHSKWQNIRHIKGAKDAEKSKAFAKLGAQMKVAVHEGGSADPKLNLKLSQLIEQARRINMPASTVQNILKSCQADKLKFKSAIVEIKGPGSCFILCEVYTDKLHALKQNLATLLRKHNSKMNEKGAKHMFEEKAIIDANVLDVSKSEADVLEEAMDHAIIAGAEDVQIVEDGVVRFFAGKTALNSTVNELEKIGYKVISASVEFMPTVLQNLNDSDLEMCSKLLEKLEAMPEVARMSDNIA